MMRTHWRWHLDNLKISADDHIDLGYLPKDLWTSRAPAGKADDVPHVVERGDGEFWVCGDATWGEYRSAKWFARPGRNPLALDRGGVAEEGRPITPSKRLDRDGVSASVLFPPIIAMNPDDRNLRDNIVRGYNDWATEFGSAAPERFIPAAMISPTDPQSATDELMRIAKAGKLKQVNFLVNDVTLEMQFEAWDPFWSAAEETGLIVSYHVGGSLSQVAARDLEAKLATTARKPAFGMGAVRGGTAFYEPFVSMFTFGTLERHPGLRLVLAESGTGWIPFVVQEMDFRYEQLKDWSPNNMPLKEKPSELFKRQVWATYQSDLVGLHLLDFFGEGHVMWASDYPHHDSTWPFSQEVVDRETAHVAPEVKQAVLHDNAAALYGIR
jgi:predicted TIM-barrel fold metal-dependent hydrolase